MNGSETSKETLAAQITGREYTEELTSQEEQQARMSGLVVVFGASDDLTEFRGAISDEAGANDGATHKIDKDGIVPDWDTVGHDDEEEVAKYMARKKGKTATIEALWCKEGEYSWTFKTELPHATFEIVEDGRPYCRGIVFNINDIK